MRCAALLVTMCAASADAAPAAKPVKHDVRVYIATPNNLADAADPIPQISIYNDGSEPIELEVSGGVPLTFTKRVVQLPPNTIVMDPDPLICGNGFAPFRIAPQSHAFFPLWARVDHGPGESGTYTVKVPYVTVGAKQTTAGEVKSEPFELAYGDVATADARDHARPGQVTVASAERERNSAIVQPSPAALAAKLLPAVSNCVAAGQRKLPWLRGRVSLHIYQYNEPAPTLYVDTSLLGDKAVNACLGAIRVTDRIPAAYTIEYVVAPPTP